MAFKGTQGPDLVSLALNIMQMKRDREFEDRRLSLEEFKAQEAARTNAIQARRDDLTFGLDMKEREAKLREAGVSLDSTLRDNEMKMGPTLDLVNDPMAAPDQRYAAARQFDQFVQSQGSQFQRAPEVVGANIGAGRGLMLQGERQANTEKESDFDRQVRLSEEQGRITDKYAQRREQREASLAAKAAETEDNALRAGKWTGKDLDNRAAVEEKRLSYTPETSRMWNQIDTLDVTKPNDILVLTYMAQKSIDSGGVVRNEDVNTWRAQGFSGIYSVLASAQAFYDKNKRYPDGFGENMKRTVEGVLESLDQKTADYDAEFKEMAKRTGMSPAMVARVEAFPLEKQKALARLAAREAAASGAPPVDYEYQRAEKSLRRNPKYLNGKIPDDVLNAEVSRLRSGTPAVMGPRSNSSGRMGGR